MSPISRECAAALMQSCEARYRELVDGGCDEDVAADRVWDTLNCALEGSQRCFDPRDRLFENKLRTIYEREKV